MQSFYLNRVLTRDEFDATVSLAAAIYRQAPDAREMDAARDLREMVLALESQSDPALRPGTDDRIALESYRRLYLDALRSGEVVLIPLPNGRTVTMRATRGVRRKQEDGTRAAYWQPVMFPELTREEVEQIVTGMARQRAILGDGLSGLGEVLKLFDKHTAARTIGEVCEAEGIDWRTFAPAEAANS